MMPLQTEIQSFKIFKIIQRVEKLKEISMHDHA